MSARQPDGPDLSYEYGQAVAFLTHELPLLQRDVSDCRALAIHTTGEQAAQRQILVAIAQHVGVDVAALPPAPELPLLKRMRVAERKIRDLHDAAPAPHVPTPEERATLVERPITPSFRPQSRADWTRVAILAVVSLSTIAAVVSQLVGH